MRPLADLLQPYGATLETVLDLGEQQSGIKLLDYLDLIRLQPEERPDGVVRIKGETVAYVLRGDLGAVDPSRVQKMRRLLAQRDDGSFLVVLTPGRIAIYAVGLDRLNADDALLEAVEAQVAAASSTLRRLHQAPPPAERQIFTLMSQLMKTVISVLSDQGLDRGDAISLAGRALFIRFLVDRGVVGDRLRADQVYASATSWPELFASHEGLQRVCAWIDQTFNGDFLPVSEVGLGAAHLDPLMAIASPNIQGDLFNLDWSGLNFAHIPVGVLGQVYEALVHEWHQKQAKKKSIFYTPRRIAEYLVRESFARLQTHGPTSQARVLDPAVGGGVFLIAAFRELAAAYQEEHQRWPSSRVLRHILFHQLTGYDIHDEALRFTSLSLYLTAIELDQPPYRFADLKFEAPLRQQVLFDVSGGVPDSPGSLGEGVPEHEACFDLVIGNPPWTSLPRSAGEAVRRAALAQTRDVVKLRLGESRAQTFDYPDKVPDLPFVWRAMRWAKPGGVLAFALHARLLFKSSKKGERARRDLFEALTVWGVLNGADLRHTPVWPNVTAPFCLLMADNIPPPPDHVFHMISPYFEPSLNGQGRLRIDPDAIHPIAVQRLVSHPTILKTLFRGTALDFHLLERMRRIELPSLGVWAESQGLKLLQGYQVKGDNNSANALHDLPVLSPKQAISTVLIDPVRLDLPLFDREYLHRPRERAIYEGPLLLLREAVRKSAKRVHFSEASIAFNESFYGMSLHAHSQGRQVGRYLAILLQSPVFDWFHLVTSGKFGVERETLLKIDVEAFPVVPFEDLTPSQRAEIDPLFEQLDQPGTTSARLSWVCQLYGLGRHAAEVITETLQMGHPTQKEHAASCPEEAMITAFAERLAQRLRPFAEVTVWPIPTPPGDPYRLLAIGAQHPSEAQEIAARRVLDMADRQALSECVLEVDDTLWIARLAQRRYWTLSRARLTAARLVEEGLVDQ